MSTNSNSFTPTPNPQQPGVGFPDALGNQFGLPFLNPEGSSYAAAYKSGFTSDLLAKAIEKQIFVNIPEQYNAMKYLLYLNPFKEVGSDEFHYKERVWGRNPLECYSWVYGTGVITLAGTYAQANDIGVQVNDKVTLASNKTVRVSAVAWNASANASTITVVAYNGASLAAGDLATGDFVSLQSALSADGINFISHYDRAETIDRYNYLEIFARGDRWGEIELQKMINMGTTDYIAQNKENRAEQMRADLFTTMFNGTRGEVSIPGATSGNYYAKTMNGIYPTMTAAGAPSQSCTSMGLVPTFETLAFQTNRLAVGAERAIFGTQEMLHELVKQFKNPVHYAPNDTIGNMNLNRYEFGGMKFVPVPCEMFGDTSMFPSFFGRMLLCVDTKSITPVKMRGVDHIKMWETTSAAQGNHSNFYKEWIVRCSLSQQFNAPASGFSVNIL